MRLTFQETCVVVVHLSHRRCEIPDIDSLILWLLSTLAFPPIIAWMFRPHCCHWGKQCPGCIAHSVYLTTTFWKQMWDTPGLKTGFFHANLSRECLVGFLSTEISTTAYGHRQYFPLRARDAFRCTVSPVISYKFTALLMPVYLSLIIKGMPFGQASLCA